MSKKIMLLSIITSVIFIIIIFGMNFYLIKKYEKEISQTPPLIEKSVAKEEASSKKQKEPEFLEEKPEEESGLSTTGPLLN